MNLRLCTFAKKKKNVIKTEIFKCDTIPALMYYINNLNMFFKEKYVALKSTNIPKKNIFHT